MKKTDLKYIHLFTLKNSFLCLRPMLHKFPSPLMGCTMYCDLKLKSLDKNKDVVLE